ncbi:hypothetical protein ACH436_00505 [Isoptericola sp. NPDC019693]|uniref:hypothetical protein n=1 Tax=Isoptericola sp. NPDC019693 TaxID=3364009 RepID=UPI0037B3B3F2
MSTHHSRRGRPTRRRAGFLITALAAFVLSACGPGDNGGGGGGGGGGGETDPPPSTVLLICQATGELIGAVNAGAAEDEIGGHVQRIRDLSLDDPQADPTMGVVSAVWSMADAWQGYLALREDPELSDGGAAFLAMVEALRQECSATLP